MIYKFIDQKGTFVVEEPFDISYLYFPLTNKEGTLLSSISPNLAGDIKKDNDKFLTIPVSIEDIKSNPLAKREFFIRVENTGKILKLSSKWEKDKLEAGFLYHKLTKENSLFYAEVINFIPFDLDVEVMWIKLINKKNIKYTPFFFLPLYGRSEKNLRDHRHVSSLLNRIKLKKYGIILKPTLIFDERGHKENKTLYFVLGINDEKPPYGQFPTLLSFFGEGLSEFPEAIYKNKKPHRIKRKEFDGKEVCAAFRFSSSCSKERNFILIMGITESERYIDYVFSRLNTYKKVKEYLEKTKNFWKNTFTLKFDFKDFHLNNWLLWVNFQPTLRRLFGCSFLPHFDYGKGGRGWRDLWQDLLTLILKDEDVEKLILNNFRGIRIDGSNATIITQKGEFIADRNQISRVWTDHGVWPLLTLELYIKKTGNLDILFKKVTYFRDFQIMRAKEFDFKFNQKDNFLRTKTGKIYKGTILEHLLLENLVAFFNVGRHNFLCLENGDWNDGLDMAPQGESIPFYCMYGYNLFTLKDLLKEIKRRKRIKKIEIFKELALLLDTISSPVDYSNSEKKRARLNEYLEKTKFSIEGKMVKIDIEKVIDDLDKKASWIFNYVREKAWLKKEGFFLGYYDNKGKPVEGKIENRIRMLLQSQVFPILSGVATKKQIKSIWQRVNKYLKDKKLKGFHLNTDFRKNNYLDLGRAFSFSFGDKENGAFFNHMIVMFAHALYKQGFIKEGFTVLKSIYKMAISPFAKIYPMIPEYFNSEGRGLYFYLTGSASWFIYTLFKEILGIKFHFGDLIIQPKLIKDNFFQDSIEIDFKFLGRFFHLKFIKPKKDTKRVYKIEKVSSENNLPIKVENHTKIIIEKRSILQLSSQKCFLEIYLK